jgi:hypothetical protein
MFFELVAADLVGDANTSTDLLKTPRRAGADCDSARSAMITVNGL